MYLGQIVKAYREKNDITMDEFSKLSKLSKGYVSMLENNYNPNTKKSITPSLKTIKAVSGVIGVDFNDLLDMLDEDYPVLLSESHDDLAVKESDSSYQIKTLAAHAIDDLTEEEQIELINYAKYLKSKREK